MRYFGIFAVAIVWLTSTPAAGPAGSDWPSYGHDPGGQRFSPLDKINRANVASLKVAWIFRTGDAYQPPRGRPTAFESTPLYIDGVLYLTTPLGRVVALDPVSGKEKWSYDSKVPRDLGYGDFANRGVSAWTGSKTGLKLFLATIDARLISIDAVSGKTTPGFSDNGIVNLRAGLRIPVPENRFADYEETSPPAVVGDTVILGSGIADNNRVDEPSGEVRGYDAATGKLKWTWDPMPQHPKTGAANAWSVIAADPARKLVFVPTGSASPDYYGGERADDNRWANSLVALNAETGIRSFFTGCFTVSTAFFLG